MKKTNVFPVAQNKPNYSCQLTMKFMITLVIIVLGTISNRCVAQDKLNEVDRIFNWTSSDAPGCICAVSQNGELVMNKAYGSADLERGVLLDTNSVLDAGSVVKQFVAVAILLLVEEGKLSLSEDIHIYIPELPDYGEKITLDHLMTHTSGIRDWTGLQKLSSKDEDAFSMILRQSTLNFSPGEEWSYSNSGYVLLKEIVSRASGMPFGDFAKKHLYDPLKMNSTAYYHNLRNIIPNRALAYEKYEGKWKYEMLFENDRGGGGALFTNPADLLIWNNAIMNNYFGQIITNRLMEPATLNNGRKLGYGRGLFLDRNHAGEVIWHSGGAAGYKTSLSHFPGKGLSIAIMCNGGERLDPSEFGARIFRIYYPELKSENSEKNTSTFEVAENELKEIQGIYLNEDGEILRMVARGNKIFIAGGPELIPQGKNFFHAEEARLSFMSQDDFNIRIIAADEFQWTTKEGETMIYKKAKPVAPDINQLQSLAGIYVSEDVNSSIQVIESNGKLSLTLEHNPDEKIEFDQLDEDTFIWRMLKVDFIGNSNYHSFKLTTPILRDVVFTKVAE